MVKASLHLNIFSLSLFSLDLFYTLGGTSMKYSPNNVLWSAKGPESQIEMLDSAYR